MSIRVRRLRLRAQTAIGQFGADIPFSNGLMILRADNSRGKSTTVQSMLFALGLERMITNRPTQAVTSAMRDRLIDDPVTKHEVPVLSSWVTIEISNERDEIAAVTRWVKDETREPSLVRVVYGPELTRPGKYPHQDYYVGRSGAAVNPRGFHAWLAEFLGWDLPRLPATDGRFVPLYMEQVFPLLFVEQRRGWAGIQAQMPYYAGVTDVKRRSIEFLLRLDVGALEVQRTRLRAEERRLQEEWRTTLRVFEESIRGHGLLTIGVPPSLTLSWPLDEPPVIAESLGENKWIPVDDLLIQLKGELRRLEEAKTPTVQTDENDTEEKLTVALNESEHIRQVASVLREELIRDRGELLSIDQRIQALQDDLREHEDIAILQRLGSQEMQALHQDCPVCHQTLPASLVASDIQVETMTSSDTIGYLKQQIELFNVMREDALRTVRAKEEQWSALRQRAAEVRTRIRALRSTLTEPVGAPSIDAITQRVRIAERIGQLTQDSERFLGVLGELGRISHEAMTVRAALRDLPADRLSVSDQDKLRRLQEMFIAQLREYDFGSFSDEQLAISRDDYLPRRDQFDLQADISASDSIRVVWAYLLSLMELSRTSQTNHPGFLLFDEPRQQSANRVSFNALLRRAAAIASGGRQVIFATSEELSSLHTMLEGLPHTLHAIDDYVLKRISA